MLSGLSGDGEEVLENSPTVTGAVAPAVGSALTIIGAP